MSLKIDEQNHPMQPIGLDEDDKIRFKPNEIVIYLLDRANKGIKTNMNDIAVEGFSEQDQMQFAQLIGYTANKFCDLSYVDEQTSNEVMNNIEQIKNLANFS